VKLLRSRVDRHLMVDAAISSNGDDLKKRSKEARPSITMLVHKEPGYSEALLMTSRRVRRVNLVESAALRRLRIALEGSQKLTRLTLFLTATLSSAPN